MKANVTNQTASGVPMDEIGGRVYDHHFEAHWGTLAAPEIDGRAVAFTNRGRDKVAQTIIKAFKAKLRAGGVVVLGESWVSDTDGNPYSWVVALDHFDVDSIRELLDDVVAQHTRRDYFMIERETSHRVCQP